MYLTVVKFTPWLFGAILPGAKSLAESLSLSLSPFSLISPQTAMFGILKCPEEAESALPVVHFERSQIEGADKGKVLRVGFSDIGPASIMV